MNKPLVKVGLVLILIAVEVGMLFATFLLHNNVAELPNVSCTISAEGTIVCPELGSADSQEPQQERDYQIARVLLIGSFAYPVVVLLISGFFRVRLKGAGQNQTSKMLSNIGIAFSILSLLLFLCIYGLFINS